MSEQTNPTPEQEEVVEALTDMEEKSGEATPQDAEQAAAEQAAEAKDRAESQGQTEETPAHTTSPVRQVRRVELNDDDDYDSDDDDDYGDDDGDDYDEEEPRYVDGPADYVQRERRGRGRRIGSDIRVEDIDYKNISMLTRFLDRRGRILSRRKTRVSAKVQRRVVREIKRARHLALLPYTADQTRIVRKHR